MLEPVRAGWSGREILRYRVEPAAWKSAGGWMEAERFLLFTCLRREVVCRN